MGNTLYLECASGISGDMTVAALLDLGADQEVLKKAIASLPVDGFSIEISRVKKSGLDACDFLVRLDEEHENHDHDMEYLHGHKDAGAHVHGSEENHTHLHGHEHHYHHTHHDEENHTHLHAHEHHHHEHPHVHRGLNEILEIINHAELSDRAKETAINIFTILAEAEAKAHGVPLDQVHFHEVGAVDSIVDIVAAAVCLDNLDITEVIVPDQRRPGIRALPAWSDTGAGSCRGKYRPGKWLVSASDRYRGRTGDADRSSYRSGGQNRTMPAGVIYGQKDWNGSWKTNL